MNGIIRETIAYFSLRAALKASSSASVELHHLAGAVVDRIAPLAEIAPAYGKSCLLDRDQGRLIWDNGDVTLAAI
jgi:hypothetical protein